MKKSLSLLLAIALVVSMFASAVSAADEKSTGEKLKETGIITGDTNGSLQEKAEWPRKDLAVILARLSGAEDEAKTFTGSHGFTDLNSKFYNPIVAWAKSEGLVTGKTETTFAPNDSVTNLEFAALTLRVLGLDKDVAYADSLTKAIELKLFPADTDAKAAALRGDLYNVIEAALNTEVDGKKLGTKLNLKGYEITELKVESASAVVGKTITVNFNDDVTSLNTTDVKVTDKDGNNVPVQSVKAEGKVATITLSKALAQKEHTVTIAKASSKESSVANATATFTYTKGVPATITLKSNTVAQSVGTTKRYVEYIVKDANGVDITGDYGRDTLVVESSNQVLVKTSPALEIGADVVGMTVINVKYAENQEVATGNQAVNVVESTSISVSKTELLDNNATVASRKAVANNTLFLDTAGVNNKGNVKLTVKDQNDQEVALKTSSAAGYKVTYTSSNPAVVAVTNSVNNGLALGTHGLVTGLQAGTATITATVEYGTATTTTTLVVTVKEAKKLASFAVDKTAVNVVYNAYEIPQTVTVTFYDQYGDVYYGAVAGNIKNTTSNGTNIVSVTGNAGVALSLDTPTSEYRFTGVTAGKVSFNVASIYANKLQGTVNLQVNVTGVANAKNVTANVVNQALSSTGYEVVYSATTLDSVRHGDDSKKKAASATISVYQLDANGNRVDLLKSGVEVKRGKEGSDYILETPDVSQLGLGIITLAPKSGATAAAPVKGTDTVTVKVNGVTIATQTIEVVATSADVVDRVNQPKASVKVSVSGTPFKVIGDGSEGAFVAYNQYGDTVGTAAIQDAISSNEAVVEVNASTKALTAKAAGTATLTVKINGTFYTLDVVVE